MDPETAREAILDAWDSYRADPQTTMTPGSFFRWLREERPELLEFDSGSGKYEQVKEWLARR